MGLIFACVGASTVKADRGVERALDRVGIDPTPGIERNWRAARGRCSPEIGRDWRASEDRRRCLLLGDWRYVFGGRRRHVRRSRDGAGAGLDHYEPRLLVLVLAILMLSAVDAVFTIRLVDAGKAFEWNPFMRVLLEWDVQLFANLKVVITSAALIFLVVLSKVAVFGRRLPVQRLLYLTLFAYVGLIGYHLALLRLAAI